MRPALVLSQSASHDTIQKVAHRLWAPTVVPVPKGDGQIWLEINQYSKPKNVCKVGRWEEILEVSSRKFVNINTHRELY